MNTPEIDVHINYLDGQDSECPYIRCPGIPIATWLVWSMKKQKLSEESELRLVSVLQNLIYTKNAQLIASMFLSDKKSFNRFA